MNTCLIRMLGVCFALGLLPLPIPNSVYEANAAETIEVGDIPVQISVERRQDGRALVTSECQVPFSLETVWSVISDYEHLEEFVPFLTESRLIHGAEGEMRLEQKGRVGLWIFHKPFSVTFLVEEQPMRTIRYTALEGDFTRFDGSWEIEPTADGTRVRHQVDIQPAFYAPRWIRIAIERYLMLRSIESVIRRFKLSDP